MNTYSTVPNRQQNRPAGQLVTIDDLFLLKSDLLSEIKKLLKEAGGEPAKKWLKSYEVRKLLDISPGTLQNLRVNGTLPFAKIGGVIYYDQEDIKEMLQSRKSRTF